MVPPGSECWQPRRYALGHVVVALYGRERLVVHGHLFSAGARLCGPLTAMWVHPVGLNGMEWMRAMRRNCDDSMVTIVGASDSQHLLRASPEIRQRSPW